MSFGLFASAFDPFPHAGHLWAMQQAMQQSQVPLMSIFAAVHGDPSIERPTKRKPVTTIAERLMMVRAIRWVTAADVYLTELDLNNLILVLRPALLIVGEDHQGHQITGAEHGIPVFYAKRRQGWSGTDFSRRIAEAWSNRVAVQPS